MRVEGYVWNSIWCWPYESVWSIMEKFKYANAVTGSVFKELIRLRSSTTNWIVEENLYIYRRSKLDETVFFDIFGVDPTHFSYLDIFRGNDFSQLLYKELHYCPRCMKVGYHSYLHQFKFLDTCLFHDEPLKCIEYNEIKVPYSIDTNQVEAYSMTQDRKSVPSEKYVDILPAKELIDGIWDSIPQWIMLNKCNYSGIRYFNPSTELSEESSQVQERTMSMVKDLFFSNEEVYKPVICISQDECDKKHRELLKRAEKWFNSIDQLFHKSDLENWYVITLIDELVAEIDENVLEHSIANMDLSYFHYSIDLNQFVKAATIIWTAFIVTNARSLQEGLNRSLIFHYDQHRYPLNLKCKFTFLTMLSLLDIRNGWSRYVNFIIYKRLLYQIYNQIYDMLREDPQLALDFHRPVNMKVPDYIIALKDGCYNIYEMTHNAIISTKNKTLC